MGPQKGFPLYDTGEIPKNDPFRGFHTQNKGALQYLLAEIHLNIFANSLNGIDDILCGHLFAHGFFEGNIFWINALNMGKTCI